MSHDKPSDSEEAYFRERELEKRRQMREDLERAAQSLQATRDIARAAGTEDMDLADRIRKLGFSGESAAVFDLLPLILVAWADGSVTQAERAAILHVLEHRGIPRDSHAFAAVEALLEERPGGAFFAESLAILRELMAGRSPTESAHLIELCAAVADASGGFFGLSGRVSDEERELIAKIADGLGSAAQEQFRRLL